MPPPTPAVHRRPAAAQLLAAHPRGLRGRCGPLGPPLRPLARTTRAGTGPRLSTAPARTPGAVAAVQPDRGAPALLLRRHPGPAGAGAVPPLRKPPQAAPA